MAKITLANILSGFNLSKINANFAAIQDVLNNKVFFRDNPVGEPNTMQQDLDMNGKNILNVGTLQVGTSFNINGLDLATQVQNAANSATASEASNQSSANYAATAQKWATQTSTEVVAGQGYGAKKYADDAAASSLTAAQNSAEYGKAATLSNVARTNLLTYSEQFDNAAWIKTRLSVTSNATTAPDGTGTADKIVEDTSVSASHYVSTQLLNFVSGMTYTLSVFAKAAERNWLRLRFNSGAFGTTSSCDFDLIAGTKTIAIGAVTSSSIQSIGNGWYRCSITATATATAASDVFMLMTGGGSQTYTGDGLSGMYIWGAQLESTVIASQYIPTTSVARTVNPGGDETVSGVKTFSGGILVPSLNGGPLSGLRNIIINGDARVSQRGSVAAVNGTYIYGGCDRICTSVNSLTSGTIQQLTGGPSAGINGYSHAVQCTTSSAGGVLHQTRIESRNTKFLNGKQGIVSCWVYQDTGAAVNVTLSIGKPTTTADTFSAQTNLIDSSVVSVPSGVLTRLYVSYTFGAAEASLGLFSTVYFAIPSAVTGKYFTVTDWQFESGSIITPFEQRDYGDELRRCKRYYQLVPLQGIAINSTVIHPTRHYEVEMRASPSMAFSGSIRRSSDGASRTPTGFNWNGTQSSIFYWTATSWSTALSAGEYYDAANGGVVSASAEL